MPEKKIEIVLTKQHRAKIAEDQMLEFLNLVKDPEICYEKPNFTIQDYTLEQFFCWNAKMMDKKFKRNKKKVLYIYK
jgi:hypothetical protein